MIRGRPSTLSGGQNKLFADCLVGRDSADGALLRVKNKREIQGQNKSYVKSSFIGFSFTVWKELVKWREVKRSRAQRRQVGHINR